MPRAVVTGASGFIGQRLCVALGQRGWDVIALVRRACHARATARCVPTGDLNTCDRSTLASALVDADVVFHLAGRAHRAQRDRHENNADAYHRDNVLTTVRLRTEAAAAGVGAFVHLSSIKVIGDVSEQPLRPDATPAPADLYASSKHDAER